MIDGVEKEQEGGEDEDRLDRYFFVGMEGDELVGAMLAVLLESSLPVLVIRV